MKKRLFASLLALVMVIGMLPMTVLAETTVATTLPEAVNGVITMTEDVNLASTFTVDGVELTLDMAGYTLTVDATTAGKDGIVVRNGGVLNLTNTSETEAKYVFKDNCGSCDAIYVTGGTVDAPSTLNTFGKIKMDVSVTANSTIHIYGNGEVNITDGTAIVMNGKATNSTAPIQLINPSTEERKLTLNMTGGTVELDVEFDEPYDAWNRDAVGVVLVGDNATANLTGGRFTVNGKNAFAQAVQIATYNGHATNTSFVIDGTVFEVNNKGTAGECYPFAIFDPSQGTIEVKNGSLTGEFDGLTKVDKSNVDKGAPKVEISGGYIDIEPTEDLVPEGKEIIEVDAENGKYLVVDPLTAMTLSAATLALPEGDTAELTVASITPATSNAGPITWTSSDEAVATVDEEGTVTAVAVGTATITATSTYFNTIKVTCEVTVTEAEEEGGDCEDDETSAIAHELNSYAMWSVFRRTFTIQVTATTGGKVTASVPGAIRYDKSVTYTMTPDEGFAVAAVYVDGVNIGAKTEYTFSRVTKNHNLSVVFEEIED